MNAGTLMILLQFYCYGEVRHCEANDQFQEEALFYLRAKGLLSNDGSAPDITEKGRVHVAGLLDAALPQQLWVSPLGGNQ